MDLQRVKSLQACEKAVNTPKSISYYAIIDPIAAFFFELLLYMKTYKETKN